MIIEGNFRVFAETEDQLKLLLLANLVQIDYRLPGLLIGRITKDSVKQALDKGITPALIIDFFENGCSSFPSEIKNLIKLWDRETNRI